MKAFDPLAFPLDDGIRLIEANAGTGKTFAITKLYLRLLMERRASVESICVATFTEAAAQELAARIADNVRRAHDIASGARLPTADPEEQLILRLIDQAVSAVEGGLREIADRLRLAQISLDRAAIGTIHGACARWSHEFAFTAGLELEPGTIDSGEALLREVQSSVWQRVLETECDAAELILGLCVDLGSFRERTRPERVPARKIGKFRDPTAAVAEASAEMDEAGQKFLCTHADQFVNDIGAYDGWKRNLKMGKALAAGAAGMVEEVKAWAASVSQGAPAPPPSWTRDAGQWDHRQWLKKGATDVPDIQPLGALERWVVAIQSAASTRNRAALALLDDLRQRVGDQFERRCRQRQLTTFDDLIDNLAGRLREVPQLGAEIARHYRWTLVDEFQDTSRREAEVFSAVYQHQGMLVMVGDPKQAIYGFKGGDVHAYLHASQQPDVGRYRLTVNYRSTPAYLAAVNDLFDARRRPFLDHRIGYSPVTAGREFAANDIRSPAIELLPVVLPRPAWVTGVPEDLLAAVIGVAGELIADGVSPAEIAVLVRSNRDATQVRQALIEAGIAAVSSSQETVFASDEALDLWRVLLALQEPGKENKVRAAAVGRLLNWTLDDLLAAEADPRRWRRLLERFADLNQRWNSGGLISAVYPLLAAAASRLLATPGGERAVTNYLHVLELAQAAEAQRLGSQGAVHWLRERIDSGDNEDAHRLRIETDDDAVRVMTTHVSKGLQFGYVIAPNLWSQLIARDEAEDLAASDQVIEFHDKNDRLCEDFGSLERATHARANLIEAMAEDVRLAYVALTRARMACWILYPSLRSRAWLSGATWLLAPPGERPEPPAIGETPKGDVPNRWLESLASSCREVGTREPPSPRVLEPEDEAIDLELAAREPPAVDADHWRVTSFSSLRRAQEADEVVRETVIDPYEAAVDEAGFPDVALPSGAAFGNAFHEIMERCDPGRPVEETHQLIVDRLVRHGLASGAATVAAVAERVAATLDTDLDGQGLRVGALAPEQRIVEMEFYFRLGPAVTTRVTRLLRDHPWSADHCPHAFDVDAVRLEGVVNGLIDLTFYWRQQYYILDYKTNWLGPSAADYTAAPLAEAMRGANYALQYLLYSVALRRHLERHQPHEFDRRFGGVYYLFVRGLGRANGAGIYHVKPPADFLAALDTALGGAS